jgi:3',5'-cyclic AMP phosphodiesterase CpdA
MNKFRKYFLVTLLCMLCGHFTFAQNFSFGMFTDVHYAAIPDNGTRKYQQSIDKVKQCLDTMNREKVGFVIELGDFKDMPVPADRVRAMDYLRTIESIFSRFRGDRYHVLGNHDEDCISKQDFYSIARNSHISKDLTYYAFQKGGYRFIVLDACFDSTGHDYDKGNFLWSDTNIPSTELTWLDLQLKATKLPVVIFVHQPLFGKTKVSVGNAAAVRAVLEQSKKVLCVFQGHDHQGGYELINGIHYYTLKALIEGNFPESNSFAIVSLSKNKLTIRGYGNAVTQSLEIQP